MQAYITSHPDLVTAGVSLVKDAGKALTDPDVVKSLIIVVNKLPWVAVLSGSDKLDEKKVRRKAEQRGAGQRFLRAGYRSWQTRGLREDERGISHVVRSGR